MPVALFRLVLSGKGFVANDTIQYRITPSKCDHFVTIVASHTEALTRTMKASFFVVVLIAVLVMACTPKATAPDAATPNVETTSVLNPDDADAYYNRGVDYMDIGQYERAIEDYTKAIQIDPNHSHT